MISNAATFAKTATVLTTWLAPQSAPVAADSWDSSRGAAAFVRTATPAAPDQLPLAGAALMKSGILPRAQFAPSGTTWHEVLGSFDEFRGLEDDWDGEGAAAPRPGVVDGAASLAMHLDASGIAPPDLAHVGVEGTVYFEWRTAHGYAEIEVTNPVDAVVRWLPKGDPEVVTISLTRTA